ncbi:hypothetical protein BJ165DRAFT_1534245 [Panaeolus papilionaceus]|nr:hypothetical protein BJ165DRAFT_1534245 [Panaeolus papilionaceus]
MQLTANLAVLATAVAYAAPSVFAYPSASNLDARDLEELDFSARDIIEEFYEARGYSEFDARDMDMDLEAREFLDFLDARAAPPAVSSTPAASSTSAAATSTSASATSAGAPAPSSTATGHHGDHPHHHAHIPSVLIHALTDEKHHKLKHYAEVELHIFNILTDLSDGEPNHHGVKESPEVEKLAKEILQLKKWHHHGHHGHKHGAHHHEHHGKDGAKPAAHEKHDGAKDATATSTSASAAPSASGSTHHGHHGHGLKHKIHELKKGSAKADRYIARAKVHRDRLALIALGPAGDNDEAFHAAVKHEKEWLERHQKLDAKHGHHHDGDHAHSADPSATGAATSTSASATPSATGAPPKADKPAEAKTAQGVKRRALRRRFF